MKTLLDVQESLKQSPPKYPKGVTFKKRVVLKRGKNGVVSYPPTNNPRQLDVVLSSVPDLRDSLSVNGYIYTCSPPTIKIDPNNKDRFVGLSGYHREAAAEQLGWETMIYDVLEFDSPLDERIHRTTSNHHRTPSLPNTVLDIVKQVKESVANNEIRNDDTDIKNLISILASDKTKKVQTQIFKKFREHISTSSTIRNYHTDGGDRSTIEFAEQHNIPFGGDARLAQTGKLGYITGIKTPKTTLYDAKKLSRAYGGKDVEIYAWIKDNPKEAPAIYSQREEWKLKFDEFILEDCKEIQFILKKLGFKVSLNDILAVHPLKFKGFLAQDISPNPLDNGNPKEFGVVDIHGNKI
jgi:hypothetical protein